MTGPTLSDEKRRDWLRLARTENVGPVTFEQLLRRFGEPAKALAAIPELSRRGGRVQPLSIPPLARIEAELAAGERLGANLICACEPAFPPLLAQIDPPPPVIWSRGRADLLQRSGVAVVGARIASAAGQRFARDLARETGEAGYLVVSGMARGVDGAAHEGALPTGTVAVLGGGVDDIYPPEHRDLYTRLVAEGCVISESPCGARAQARDFPRRNRLISGLSLAVIVVEAELRSGSLITARLANEQGREVLAVPGSPLDPRSKGTNDLIRQGAAICEGVDDVLRAIAAMSSLREPEQDAYRGESDSFDSADKAFDALRERIAALASPTPVSHDELVRIVGAPTPVVYAALTELALAGRIALLAGGLVVVGEFQGVTARRPFGQRYAFVVVAATFLALLAAAGLRAAPSVLMLPLQTRMGWDRTTVSSAAAIGILLYGLVGPFAAALMQTIGIRRTLLGGLALMSVSTFASLFMTQPWQYLLTWGVFSGIGSGAVAGVLGAAVVNRWFATRQGLVMGLLTASTATGSLIFLPFLAMLTSGGDWRGVVMTVSGACAVLLPFIALLMPERPADIGLTRFGETSQVPTTTSAPTSSLGLAFAALRRAASSPMFWLLFGTFFICGLTTNGLVGAHLIAYCGDHGIPPVKAAGLLSLMGLFDLFGTTASGWLTDRYEPRHLLVIYYGLRGLSLIVLPFLDFGPISLSAFAVFYGLDWIATVPPTVKLANLHFGERDAPIVFGWVLVGHQIGAATAAFGAGLLRQQTGSYQPAFVLAGIFGLGAAAAMILLRPAAPAVALAQ